MRLVLLTLALAAAGLAQTKTLVINNFVAPAATNTQYTNIDGGTLDVEDQTSPGAFAQVYLAVPGGGFSPGAVTAKAAPAAAPSRRQLPPESARVDAKPAARQGRAGS